MLGRRVIACFPWTLRTMTKQKAAKGLVRAEPSVGLLRLDDRALVSEAVQKEIVRFIRGNGLVPGDQLPPEGEIAKGLGVGRNSVREAVGALRALGVIDVRVGTGLFVRDLDYVPVRDYFSLAASFDFRRLIEIRDIRMYLENGLVERVIEKRSEGQIVALECILDEWASLAARDIYPVDLDRNFHKAMWGEIGNAMLVRILDIFWDVVREGHQRGILIDPIDKPGHQALHRAMLDAFRRGDAEGMRRSITAHFNDVNSRPMLRASETVAPLLQ